jgi:thiamine phosphate synthase YjbQ (UPF0047 family)
MWFQKEITLQQKKRGFHLVTNEILNQVPEIRKISVGLMHVFIQHTSASLTLNENAPHYVHTTEGADDMPAHIKASLLGSSVTIPITNGKLNLGTWQGIYLCEHRNYGGARNMVVTINGEE